ncbi:tetratricopeptide repeat protein [Bacillus cereus]|uniref:tetratricopeptide repeat protein n=1 Tax=Bacillus cereus TaxID=1396 RepID=UPI000B4B8202|nr:tetratricopeptide repeat protein [Bacillus cereus]
MKKIFQLYPDNYYTDKAKESFQRGMNQITEGEYAKAYYYFREAIDLDPEDVKYYFFAGLSSYYFQEDSATEYFEKAAILEDTEPDYQMWYGISLYRDQRYADAKKVLIYAFSLDKNNEKTVQYLIKTFNRLGEYGEVNDFILNKIPEEKQDTELLYELGYSYLKEFEFEKAKDSLLKSINLDSKNVMSYYFLSRVYCKTGEFESAIYILNKLLEEVPNEKELVEKNIKAIELLQSF